MELSFLIYQLNTNFVLSSQTYLQSFIGLCSKIPDCPISSMTGRPLTKRDLCDFAPFFKQGIFEQTKHYSGQSSGQSSGQLQRSGRAVVIVQDVYCGQTHKAHVISCFLCFGIFKSSRSSKQRYEPIKYVNKICLISYISAA